MKICPLTVEEVCPDIHIDMAMPVGYASTELVHQFAHLEPFGKTIHLHCLQTGICPSAACG